MNDRAPQAVPAQLTESKGANLFRELFNSDFWISGQAMLKYIPRSFRKNDIVRMEKAAANPHRLPPEAIRGLESH